MSALQSNHFRQAAAFIAAWKRPLLLSHTKPDGDALGCLIAMRSLLRCQGVEALSLLFEPMPHRYESLSRLGSIPVLGHDIRDCDLSGVDGVIILDTCTYSQLEPVADWLRASRLPKLAVDHHATRDSLADHYVIDEPAAAACLILYDWAKALQWLIDDTAARALFTGMATDTGWFRHSNTDHRVLAAASGLAAWGVAPHELYEDLFSKEAPGRIRLLGAAIESLELHAAGRLAVMTLPASTFARCGATQADTEDIVNEPLRIGSVLVSILLVEQNQNQEESKGKDKDHSLVRVSFRSKPPRGDLSAIDVADIAATFGGGGHTRAAGARISGSLDVVRQAVIERLRLHLGP